MERAGDNRKHLFRTRETEAGREDAKTHPGTHKSEARAGMRQGSLPSA